jgi:apolipoprotein D and lipocalin family protein
MRILPFLLSLSLQGMEPPPVVPKVDLVRYMGTWYEIAKYPNRFQQGCLCTTATYTLKPSGKVAVVNRCRAGEGRQREAKGWAKVVDPSTNAKLKVTFFWPFFGDYWILDLDEDYTRVLVGSPDRRFLWILSRTPRMAESEYQALAVRAAALGFDPTKLTRTDPCGAEGP